MVAITVLLVVSITERVLAPLFATNALVITSREVEPEMLPEVAEIVVVPTATAVTSPVGVMVATPVLVDAHVTEAVTSVTEPSEKTPKALNCRDVPGAILELAVVTVIETRAAEEELPPLQAASKITNEIRIEQTKYLAILSSFPNHK